MTNNDRELGECVSLAKRHVLSLDRLVRDNRPELLESLMLARYSLDNAVKRYLEINHGIKL